VRSSFIPDRAFRWTTARVSYACGKHRSVGSQAPSTPLGKRSGPPSSCRSCASPRHTFHQSSAPPEQASSSPRNQATDRRVLGEDRRRRKPRSLNLPMSTGSRRGTTACFKSYRRSTQSAAASLGVNFVRKLATRANTPGVQMSSSNNPTGFNVTAGVVFSQVPRPGRRHEGLFPARRRPGGAGGNPDTAPWSSCRTGSS